MTTQRVVVCAASRLLEDEFIIICGARHCDSTMHNILDALHSASSTWRRSFDDWEQGFIDQYGVFMTRKEALEVATKAGQINTRRKKGPPLDVLFSEDLY